MERKVEGMLKEGFCAEMGWHGMAWHVIWGLRDCVCDIGNGEGTSTTI